MDPKWVDLTDEQRELYVRIQQQGLARVRATRQQGETLARSSILGILVKLKQVCNHPALINHRAQPLEGRSEKYG